MKITTGILGCALVAGLMAFASDKAQAGTVINNVLYSPVKLKLTTTYNKNGKLSKMSITSKEVLKDLGYNTGQVKLAVDNDVEDVWLINKDTTIKDLTTNNIMGFDYSWYSYAYSGNNDSKYIENGTFELWFYDTGSESEWSNYFDISGIYTFNDSYGKTDKNGYYNEKESYKANNLSGEGYFSDIGDYTTVSGNFSSKGSGKILD